MTVCYNAYTMQLIFKWLVYTLAIAITGYLLPGVEIYGLGATLLAALFLGLVNVIVRPILVFFTLPLTILSFGLSVLAINALLVLFVDWLIEGLVVANFWWALLFSLIVSLFNWLLNKFLVMPDNNLTRIKS